MAKGCALSSGYLSLGGLPRNSVDRITDHPDMTSAVDSGRNASTQTNKQCLQWGLLFKWLQRYVNQIYSVGLFKSGLYSARW